MWGVVLSVLLCACANGLTETPPPAQLAYRMFPGLGRYFYQLTPNNWTDASQICQRYNGHLAYPRSMDEANALWDIMDEFNVTQLNIGFHDQFIEGSYITSRGKPISASCFEQWSSGSPIGSTSYNCGGLRRDGLTDVACESKYPSICEESDGGTGGLEDYVFIEGHGYYKFNPSRALEWPEALKECYLDGAHLWIINSAEEHQAVFSKFNYNGEFSVWVGAHHVFANRYFLTIFDESLESTGFSTWYGNEPSGDNVQYPYVTFVKYGFSISSGYHSFVCEYNPGKV